MAVASKSLDGGKGILDAELASGGCMEGVISELKANVDHNEPFENYYDLVERSKATLAILSKTVAELDASGDTTSKVMVVAHFRTLDALWGAAQPEGAVMVNKMKMKNGKQFRNCEIAPVPGY